MASTQPKQLSAFLTMVIVTVLVISCNNSADSSKTVTDSTKVSDTSKMTMPADTLKKTDTTKMDTASTRPVKTT